MAVINPHQETHPTNRNPPTNNIRPPPKEARPGAIQPPPRAAHQNLPAALHHQTLPAAAHHQVLPAPRAAPMPPHDDDDGAGGGSRNSRPPSQPLNRQLTRTPRLKTNQWSTRTRRRTIPHPSRNLRARPATRSRVMASGAPTKRRKVPLKRKVPSSRRHGCWRLEHPYVGRRTSA